MICAQLIVPYRTTLPVIWQVPSGSLIRPEKYVSPEAAKIPDKYKCLNDGAALTSDPCAQDSAQSASDSKIALGSPAENALVNTLIAGEYGTTPDKVPPIATALAAPLLRGTTVDVK